MGLRLFLAALTFSTLQCCAITVAPEPVLPSVDLSREKVIATFGNPIWRRRGRDGTECLLFDAARRTATGASVNRNIEVLLQDGRVVRSALSWPLQSWGLAGVVSPCD